MTGGGVTMTEKYKVGYGKPPKEHQWKKGQSGNPSGKKRKASKAANAKPLLDYVVEELLESVSLTIGGKTKKIPVAQAFAKSFARDLLQAPLKAKILALKQLKELGVFHRLNTMIEDARDEAESDDLISEDERLMLDAVYKAAGLGEQDKSM